MKTSVFVLFMAISTICFAIPKNFQSNPDSIFVGSEIDDNDEESNYTVVEVKENNNTTLGGLLGSFLLIFGASMAIPIYMNIKYRSS